MDTQGVQNSETITVRGQPPAEKSHLWAGDHFSFHDLLDAINPLQHIPIVNTIYREVTGDTIGNAARVVGDGLYGGVIGVIAGLVDVDVKETTGKDIGGHVMATLGIDDDAGESAPATAVADAATNPAEAPPAAASPSAAPTLAKPAARTPASSPMAPPPQPMAPPPQAVAAAASFPLKATQAAYMPLESSPKMMPLDNAARGFAIDTSNEGLQKLHAIAANAPRQVPLNVPPGTLPLELQPQQRPPLTGGELAQRMQDGLDKYRALMAQQQTSGAAPSVNQVQ